MGDRMKEIREKSKKRKQLLAQAFGVGGPGGLRDAIMGKGGKKSSPSPASNTANPRQTTSKTTEEDELHTEQEEVYTDSSTFLKGLQSANPHNDYNQNFVDIGERPQNYIRDVGLANRFEEYPKLRELMRLKDELVIKTNTPPMYLQCDLDSLELRSLKSQFDVILLEPPLEEYQRCSGVKKETYWSWDEIEKLDIPSVAAQRSFIWIWCGNDEGLERGRLCLKRWGYRRCEDICWIKTNIKSSGQKIVAPDGILQRTKEHCLMGIKGTVKRSTDGDFIHANVDIDLIIEEEAEYGSKDKPVEIFHIIEHFCLGRRRLHIFGRDSTIRKGWLTLGPELTLSNFDADTYAGFFTKQPDGHVTGCTDEIERLRPKSPTQSGGSGDRGRGRGRSSAASRGGFAGRGARGAGFYRARGAPQSALHYDNLPR